MTRSRPTNNVSTPRLSTTLLLCTFALLSMSNIGVVHSFSPLNGITATSIRTNSPQDLHTFLTTPPPTTPTTTTTTNNKSYSLLILGTYAADFNAIEYAQRLRYYLPSLRRRGVTKFGLVLNCEESAARALTDAVDLDIENDVEVFVDPNGDAGRAFGVGRGWREDDEEMSPYLKLFGMLWGLGAWATLPAVIGGYIGNPFTPQPWIEDALAVGQRKGRWPNNALELDETTGAVTENKFAALPFVGGWKRRPLELATLRLQNMIDISVKNWKELAPGEGALERGVLTQLGGCVVVENGEGGGSGDVVFEWKDPGICAVANFEDILEKLPVVVMEEEVVPDAATV